MLVDKEKVLKAKQKLGDKNAHIIAELLNIEEYNERDMKGLCPMHNEDTPSFIYNPKKYNFHCFGCGRNIDIIDAYMMKGNTYIQAIQKLFSEAKIKYSFGEVGVQTRTSYRYPKPEYGDDKTAAYQYLESRKISKETTDYLGIQQDKQGNMLFQYYDTNDVLTMVKVRPSRRIAKSDTKTWCLQGADTTPLLFNLNKLNTDMPLLITSGELDCAAAIEAGFRNACSIPLGDQNTQWVNECWETLENFDEIIIAYDNDESGNKFIADIVPRLGSWRCKVIDLPSEYETEDGKTYGIKDLNEYLFAAGKNKLLDLIIHAKDTPVPSVVDFSDIEDRDFSDIDGVEFGIEELDKQLMKLFYGSFTVFSGKPGSGKTSFLYQIICNAIDSDRNTWLFSRELPDWMTRNWILYLMAGCRNLNQYQNSKGATYWKVKPKVKKEIGEYYQKKLFIYNDDYPNDIESIQTSMTDSARKYGCKLFIIDNMTTVNLQANEANKYEKQTDFINWLIQFSMKYNVATILVNHPRKMQFDAGDSVGIYDLSGTANIANLAHRAIGLRRVKPQEKEGVPDYRGTGWKKKPCPYDVVVTIIKDRLKGMQDMEVGLYYDNRSRRFYTNPAEFDRHYGWDTSPCGDDIEYPVKNEVEEIIGRGGDT